MLPVKALAHLTGLLFGLLFNAYVERQGRNGVGGVTAIWVMIGTLATLIIATPVISTLIDTQAIAWYGQRFLGMNLLAWYVLRDLLVVFATTGTPMLIGSINRHMRKLL